MATGNGIPMRDFGRTGVKISALGLGGHHLGDPEDESTARQIVHMALDGGVNFFDNCWEYHRGKCEDWLGAALKGHRQNVFLMTKVCTHGRDKALAMKMLEESLRRLQTDHLDLWQIHGVSFENDPELFIRPNGAAEALRQAKQQGKVRFVGFTGHKRPELHLAMLKTGFPFDAVQMPLNPFDHHFFSFEKEVLPEVNRRGIAALGMKPINGTAAPVKKGALTAEEALRYAMSLPVATTIAGVDKPEIMQHHLRVAQGFTPMPAGDMDALRARVRDQAADGRFEPYKTSLKFDNPEARLAHEYPLDMQQKEVKEMLGSVENNGKPWPKYSPQPQQ
ncbi:MAG TPA: aldo/keto reductase [Bryobacteraceae bacterium]|nr:aldo/keto reductase [Bryobacteraceae bacterium]